MAKKIKLTNEEKELVKQKQIEIRKMITDNNISDYCKRTIYGFKAYKIGDKIKDNDEIYNTEIIKKVLREQMEFNRNNNYLK